MSYDGSAQPENGFASQLERDWDCWFRMRGWRPSYIGHNTDWADFVVEGYFLEVKPVGREFVQAALDRAAHADRLGGYLDIIVEGHPNWGPKWWFRRVIDEQAGFFVIDGLYPLPGQLSIDTIDVFGSGERITIPAVKPESLPDFIKRATIALGNRAPAK